MDERINRFFFHLEDILALHQAVFSDVQSLQKNQHWWHEFRFSQAKVSELSKACVSEYVSVSLYTF